MSASLDPVAMLAERFAVAIRAAFPALEGDVDPLIAPSKQANLGDFQCNAAMPLAKRLGKPPREIATAIVQYANIDDIAEGLTPASIAGPGFINIRLRDDALSNLLAALDTDQLGVAPAQPRQTIVVDLCGVNLAKEMHIGHLRATIIGDALARVMERLGHNVIRQNHVGDWGLPIAMVAARLQVESHAGRIDLDTITLDRLTVLYRDAQLECRAEHGGLAAARRFGMGPKAIAELEEQVAGADDAMDRAKDMLLRMQAHDATAVAYWKRIYDVTMASCLEVCRRLHAKITDADSAGESSYAEELAPMVADLVKRGVAEESEGALVIRLDRAEDGGIDVPVMIRKRDGGYLYATTDIAAVRRRVQKLGADRVLYAVGAPQILHLKQVFAAARKAGYATKPGASEPSSLEHAAFGSILGDDGRPFRTRSGENVRLSDVLDEAFERALRIVAEKSAELAEGERRGIAEAVAIAAIKYADLSSDRIKDYVFNFDRMLAFEGNAGPYLLNALVRIKSIFRKAHERGLLGNSPLRGESSPTTNTPPFTITEPAEKALALTLLRYPATVASVAAALEPHRLCALMYDLAGAFAVFYDQCPVLQASDDVRQPRLRLCALTARILEDGLRVLGIPTVERM